MKLRSLSYSLFFCFVLVMTSCSQESAIFKEYETIFRIGDQQEWAKKNLNVQNWRKRIAPVPDGQVFWSRTKVDILKASGPLHPYGMQLHVYGEYEVFWDGCFNWKKWESRARGNIWS